MVIILRLKNVKNASNIIKESSYVVLEPKKMIGKWSDVFENENKIQMTEIEKQNCHLFLFLVE